MTGDMVKKIRHTLGLTQIEFAEELQRSQVDISNWETGTRKVPVYMNKLITMVYKDLKK